MRNFTIHNDQSVVSIDKTFWKRAFNYAARELQIEHLYAEVHCLFIAMDMERQVKFKSITTLGSTSVMEEGAWFYVVATGHPYPQFASINSDDSNQGQMVRTFFHEMTHVKQLLVGDLVLRPRHRKWKGEKWDNREYSFAPWEEEANAFSDKAYAKFQELEVNRVMGDKAVEAYHPSVTWLCSMFSRDEVFRLTQAVYKERERQALLSSGRDWLLVT